MPKAKYLGDNKNVNLSKQVVYSIWVNEGELDYIYIGSGTYSRCNGNLSKLRRNVHDTPLLQDAYNRNKNYKIELLAFNLESDNEARAIEDEYIKHFERLDGVTICNVRGASNGCTSENYNRYKRLTKDKVIEIKERLQDYSNKQLADMYNCSSKAISDIRRGIRWTKVTVESEVIK
ncbi:hypothetical protein [Clostridium sp. BL-8]|uniref:hypothetical protein n=1 Tax=Clostridium sp. BL-8 TaxID=349938 RepID=UPI00098C5D26|nr:hypothetical protein [Clostridium sp. BL-8]OOM76595.1 hypothetical protein CLOBL_34800 [Clostridium sp. BL-8]